MALSAATDAVPWRRRRRWRRRSARHSSDALRQSYSDFVRRYRTMFPAGGELAADVPGMDGSSRTRREFGWRSLTVPNAPAVAPLWKREPATAAAAESPPAAAPSAEAPSAAAPSAAVPSVPSGRHRLYRRPHSHIDDYDDEEIDADAITGSWDTSSDDDDDVIPAAKPQSDEEHTDVEEEVIRGPPTPRSRIKSVAAQHVDVAWVKAGLLDLVGHGRLRKQLRKDVRDKVVREEIVGALRPMFATNFTARFTAPNCDSVHEFREGIETRLNTMCWYCEDANLAAKASRGRPHKTRHRADKGRSRRAAYWPAMMQAEAIRPQLESAEIPRDARQASGMQTAATQLGPSYGVGRRDERADMKPPLIDPTDADRLDDDLRGKKCMQLCQISQLDVACKRRYDEHFLAVIGMVDPVEGRRFRHACNDTCMEEWELLMQYGAAARLRALLSTPAAAVQTEAGLSSPVLSSVRVQRVTNCASNFQLRYRLCYPIGTWAQRAVVDLEHTATYVIVGWVVACLLLLCCICTCCYYRILQIPRVAAGINGWLRRRRLKWRVAGGLERTESGHYRRPSMVSTGAHGKKSREQIRHTVDRWRRQREAEGRPDGAPPRSLYSTVRLVRSERDEKNTDDVWTERQVVEEGGDDTPPFSDGIDTGRSD